jgi:hypothetical protein
MNFKKYLFTAVCLITLSYISISCDSINTLPLNVPISFEFELAGAGLTDSQVFCMDENDSYIEYQGDIKQLSLLRIIYRTDASDNSVVPETLQGSFEMVIKRSDTNEILLQKIVNDFRPADYKKPNKPYELELSTAEKAIVNNYMNSRKESNPCFEGTVSLLDYSGGGLANYINGHIDVLIEVEVEL